MRGHLDQLRMVEEASGDGVSVARFFALAASGPKVEAAVAKNPSAPLDLLERLSKTGKALTWMSLLENPALPMSCYSLLFARVEHQIDRAMAVRPQTPREIIEKIYRRGYNVVLTAMARSEHTPPSILEALSNHPSTKIYRAALKNPKNPLYIEGAPWQRFSMRMSSFLIQRQQPIPLLLLDRFVRSSIYQDQIIAAWCPSLTPEMFALLASREAVWVRAIIARNPALPEETARVLAKDPNLAVTNALAFNPVRQKQKKR